MTDFSKYLVKQYKHWSVYVHENQSYLGRCAVWCDRADALDLADATEEEQAELFEILADLKKALKESFNPDWFNYAFLGNATRHLHGHIVPRYEKPTTFMDTYFEDIHYGYNYRTDHAFVTTEDLLEGVRSKLEAALKK